MAGNHSGIIRGFPSFKFSKHDLKLVLVFRFPHLHAFVGHKQELTHSIHTHQRSANILSTKLEELNACKL